MRLLRAVSKMVSVNTVMQHLKNPPLEAQDFAKFDVSYKNFVQLLAQAFVNFDVFYKNVFQCLQLLAQAFVKFH